MKTLFPLLTFIFLCLSQVPLKAAPPANDNKAGAATLTGLSPTASATNTEATSEAGDFANRTVWWKWVAPANGRLLLDTVNSPAKFLRLKVFLQETAGVAGGVVAVAESAVSTSDPSLSFPVVQGTSYLIGVGNQSTTSGDAGVINLALNLNTADPVSSLSYVGPVTMANDAFANRITLAGSTPSAMAYNASATREAGEPSTGNTTFWWTYRPTANGRLTISSQGSSALHKTVNVFLGSNIASLRLVDAHAPSLSSDAVNFSFPVTMNTDYQISFGTTSSTTGTMVLSLNLDTSSDVSSLNIPNPATMANDNFANRVLLTGNTVGAIAYNASGTNEAGEPTISGAKTFWWSHRPAATGRLTISSQGTDAFHKTVVVYFGDSLGGLRPVAYYAPSTSSEHINLTFPVTADTEYHISFGTQTSSTGSIVLALNLNSAADVSLLNVPLPATNANDNFANRVTLPGNKVSAIGYNIGATREALEPAETKERTLWWSWTAQNSGQTVLDFVGSSFLNRMNISVWTGASFSAPLTGVGLTGGSTFVSFAASAGTTYHIAVGSTATAYGGDIVMTVFGADPLPNAPNFTSHPVSKWVGIGSALNLTSNSDDSAATYQWRKASSDLSGATNKNLSLPITTLTQSGVYDVAATNVVGTNYSDTANVGVFSAVIPSINTTEGAKVTLSITAQAPGGVRYKWHLDGEPLTDGKLGTRVIVGALTNQLVITGISAADAGSYTCELRMLDPLGEDVIGTSGTSTVSVLSKPVVADIEVPVAAVSSAFTWQLSASDLPTAFIVSGLPSGLTVNLATGLITGVPNLAGQSKIKVSAKNAAGPGLIKEFILNVDPLTRGLAGSYTGLVARHDEIALLGGTIATTVTTTGALTGTLKLGATSYSFKGRVMVPETGDPVAITSVALSRTSTAKLTLSFQPDNSIIYPESSTFSAELESGAYTAQMLGRRLPWSKTYLPTNWAGAYNVLIQTDSNLSNIDELPRGMGYMQMTVNATSGLVTVTGRAGDGTAFTGSYTLWNNGKLPLYCLLYGNKGHLMGLPEILGSIIPAQGLVMGSLDWLKTGPATTTDRLYSTGFDVIGLTLDGSVWVKPTPGTMLFGLPNQAGNARVEFSHAGIEDVAQAASVSQTFQITSTHTAKFATATTGNPCLVSMTLNAATGLFTGTFKLSDLKPGSTTVKVLRTVSYSGILMNHLQEGYGWFQLPGLSSTTTPAPTLSGLVRLKRP
jgi:hypothetical protein